MNRDIKKNKNQIYSLIKLAGNIVAQSMVEYILILVLVAGGILMMQHYVFRSMWAGFKFWERQIGDSMRPPFYSDRPCMSCIPVDIEIYSSGSKIRSQTIPMAYLGSLNCYYPDYWGRYSMNFLYNLSSDATYSRCANELWCWWGVNVRDKAEGRTYDIKITGGAPGITGKWVHVSVPYGCDPPNMNCKDMFDKWYGGSINTRKAKVCTNYAKCCNPLGGNICNGCPCQVNPVPGC